LTAVGLALLVVGLIAATFAIHRSGLSAATRHRPAFLLLFPVAVAPLPLAARYPLLSWRIALLTALLVPLIPDQSRWDPAQIAVLVVVFCIAGLLHPRRVLWWMSALTLLPIWLWTGPELVKPASVMLGLVAITIAVDAVGGWRRARRALAAQAERVELEKARRAVLEERARIARELHDVVAHHLSLIAVQAETAPYRLDDLPDDVRPEFASMSQAAREALTDMRKLLGVLRDDAAAERTPQPQLADLPELIAASRRAGVHVELSIAADGEIPPGLGLCAYRIVQEALSNASQHAPGSAVTVSVQRDDDSVRLQVRNGRGTSIGPPPNGHRRGHGLAGMQERAALQGGTLTAAARPDGGFAVFGRPAARWSAMTTKCLIADDQAMVREGFGALLAAQPDLVVVGQAADGADAVRQSSEAQPDVVLMDVRMPVMDGLQATREILAGATGYHRPRVLMLTTFDLDDYVYEALRAGASGFLLKDAPAAELIHAVRVVAAGDALLAPSVTRRLIADYARRPRPNPPPAATLDVLTPRETEVLRLIARGLSNAEISDALVIAEQTTKTHIGRILTKLSLRNRAQAVVIAYESGVVAPGD